MGRDHSFMDCEFGISAYDPSDDGEYIPNMVTVAMPFLGEERDEIYTIIKEECANLNLKAQRVDEFTRSCIVVRDIAEAIEQAEFLIFSGIKYIRIHLLYLCDQIKNDHPFYSATCFLVLV